MRPLLSPSSPPPLPQVGTISEAFPHIIVDNLGSKLGQRAATILKHLFPVPKVGVRVCAGGGEGGGH